MFGIFSSDSCNGHHFGETRETGDYRIRQVGGPTPECVVYDIQERCHRRCQHEGCWETKEKWVTQRRVTCNEWEALVDGDADIVVCDTEGDEED